MGSPFGSGVILGTHKITNEGFLLGFSDFKFFRDGVTLLGSSICIHTFSIGSKEIFVADCCALALLGV